jgi:hypothetical protein
VGLSGSLVVQPIQSRQASTPLSRPRFSARMGLPNAYSNLAGKRAWAGPSSRKPLCFGKLLGRHEVAGQSAFRPNVGFRVVLP